MNIKNMTIIVNNYNYKSICNNNITYNIIVIIHYWYGDLNLHY